MRKGVTNSGQEGKGAGLIPHWKLLIPALLLNLVFSHTAPANQWVAGPGYRSFELSVPASGRTGFTLLSSNVTGIAFSNTLSETLHLTNQIFLDGSGLAAGDVDGDGLCDLYFCALDGHNVLYRNLGGWRFEDITDKAGVACSGLRSSGAAFADLDGDGALDLIVNTYGQGTHIFFNDGHGKFTHAPAALNPGKGGKSVALADVDGDGYLDVYVVNYRVSALMDIPNARATFKTVNGKQMMATFNGRPVTEPDLVDRFNMGPHGEVRENGEPDVLYHNSGGTNFVAVSFTEGNFLDQDGKALTKAPLDWGLAAMFRDVNGDGLPDLYVCNDFESPDRFWINQGGGKFRLLPRQAQRKSSLSSMAVDFADINRDGKDDFFVVDMLSRDHAERLRFMLGLDDPSREELTDCRQYQLNTLQLNRGDNTFAEIAQLSGLDASEWTWSGIFLDVDLDGWEDVLIANGMERTSRDLDVIRGLKALRASRKLTDGEIFAARRAFPRQANGNLAFRNRGDLTFEETSKAWGFDFKGVSCSMALADLDNDGDLDVVVNPLNGPALIYRNETIAPRVAVRLKGLAPNTKGIGARIGVSGGAVPVQSQEMISGGRYLASDDAVRVFAAGTKTNRMTIEVAWRGGRRSLITNALPNYLYEVDEAGAELIQPGEPRLRCEAELNGAQDGAKHTPLFEDVSAKLCHVHDEEPFDDFARQPLLPNKLSQFGPGVAWFDVDGDGREDLIIGAGNGGEPGVYLNQPTRFRRLDASALLQKNLHREQTGIVAIRSTDDQPLILIGNANYEDGRPDRGSVVSYDVARGKLNESIPGAPSSTGPLAVADLTGEGKLSLFVGGRVIPDRYPETASSRLFILENGKWRGDASNDKALENVGLVSGAIFSDLDGDGFPELILACEWGPIRIFHNDHGKLSETNIPLRGFAIPGDTRGHQPAPATLKELTGWWTAVTSGDFDGDGRQDVIAVNWGRNSKYEQLRTRALSLYYGDFNGDGSVQLVEAHFDPRLQKTVPLRSLDALTKGMPFLRQRFGSHAACSTASVEELLGDRFNDAKHLEVCCLESLVLLNRGDHFEARALPIEAQMAPGFGVCAGDFDGDGKEDVFVAQNFFATQPETPRYDAGRGLVLRGDGRGGFRALPGQESGIVMYGQQRGAAVCDFDNDGRLDLAVTQNGAETKLYHNLSGKPGLRVKLKGPPGNRTAIGAVMRIKGRTGWGPARELHAGSGYWSQDSAVTVVALPEGAEEMEVRWPGGKRTLHQLTGQTKEVVFEMESR